MSDQPLGSAATFFDTTSRAAGGGGLRHSFKKPADILRALGIPREVPTESPIPAGVWPALGLPAEWLPPPTSLIATACFEMHVGNAIPLDPKIKATQLPAPPPQTVIPFTVTVDLVTTPHTVLSGFFIYESTEVTGWKITQGTIAFVISSSVPSLYIVGEWFPIGAKGEPPSAGPAPWVEILGWYTPSMSFPGYFFTSTGGLWSQTTLFKGWQACSLAGSISTAADDLNRPQKEGLLQRSHWCTAGGSIERYREAPEIVVLNDANYRSH